MTTCFRLAVAIFDITTCFRLAVAIIDIISQRVTTHLFLFCHDIITSPPMLELQQQQARYTIVHRSRAQNEFSGSMCIEIQY
jgi:hypothetical protein